MMMLEISDGAYEYLLKKYNTPEKMFEYMYEVLEIMQGNNSQSILDVLRKADK